MALKDLQLPPITFRRAVHSTAGRVEPVIAFVNHRMVGTLAGTDAYFTNPKTRPVSTHFGIGYGSNGDVKISQYVALDDTAYGNGNYDPSGRWDEWGYKTSNINAQTISIEHQDHGDPGGKGIVSAKTQIASQKLQALLRYGTIAQWKAAGIVVRDWADNAPILQREFRRIPVDGRHIITHHDISGKLKPYCWRPWQYDKIGFSRTRYVTEIKYWGNVLLNTLPDVPPVVPGETYTQAQLDAAVKEAVTELEALLAQAVTAASSAQNAAATAIEALEDFKAKVGKT